MSGAGGSFALDTNPTTLFSGTPGTTYVLQWTISNGVCTASSDQVTIKLDANPLPAAAAGQIRPYVQQCDLSRKYRRPVSAPGR